MIGLLSCDRKAEIEKNEKSESDTSRLSFTMNMACMDSLVLIGEFMGEKFFEGGISGLTYIPGTKNEFYAVNDRGPNTSLRSLLSKENTVLFPFPDYSQKVIRLKFLDNKFFIISLNTITDHEGTPISGFPADRKSGSACEIPNINLNGTKATNNRCKYDLEGIAIDDNGDLWVVDEYRPAVLKIDGKSFQIKQQFSAESDNGASQLPEIYTKRKANRGFEGVAVTPSGKILAILQSPLETEELYDSIPNRLVRILYLDPISGNTKTFGCELSDSINDPKIGDMDAINENEFLIIEHGINSSGKTAHVFKINIQYATNIETVSFNEGKSFESFKNNAKAQFYGVTLVNKSHVLNLIKAGFNPEFGKPEGITLIDKYTFAIVNDNDYAIEGVNEKRRLIMNKQASCLYTFKCNKAIFNTAENQK